MKLWIYSSTDFDKKQEEYDRQYSGSLTFFESPQFQKEWEAHGLDDFQLSKLQSLLMEDPHKGRIVSEHSGGVRKLRIPMRAHGRRGGGRLIYIDYLDVEAIFLLRLYSKDEKANLSEKYKKSIRNELKSTEAKHE